MAVPTWQDIMRPFLERLARAEGSVRFSDLCEDLGKCFPQMTKQEFENDRLASGQRRFLNRVGWTANELKHANFIRSPKRAYYEITKSGRFVIEDEDVKIDRHYLIEHSEEYREYADRLAKKSRKLEQSRETIAKITNQDDERTPDEEIDDAIQKINESLAKDILERTREISPESFGQLTIDLLLAMGYDASGEVFGRSGDDGIDGIIRQDKLGIDRIYIQAKRYREGNSVAAREVRDFSGALEMKRMHKGIFVTTSSFTLDAKQTVRQMQKHIILIDGKQLAKLMVDYNVGCIPINLVRKEVKEDYFE